MRKKKMLKTNIFILLMLIIFCFTGCGNVEVQETDTQNTTETQSDQNLTEEAYSEEKENVSNDNQEGSNAMSQTSLNKTVMLNSGHEMPVIGYGTWTFSDDEVEELAYIAIKDGYRLIDTAAYYGNEVGVGRAVRRAIEEGIITREDIFVTSKIYASTDHSAAIEKSLNNLDIDYIDLLLIHQPFFDDKGLYQTMEKYYNDGLLKSIGLSNYYTKEAIDEVLSYATVMPAVIQNENHIYYQNNELQEYVSQYGIIIESYYPFGGRGHTKDSLGNEVIVEIAEKYGKTAAQVILRWHIQSGYVAIPGSGNPEHILENISIFDFELSEEDLQRIKKLNTGNRYENW